MACVPRQQKALLNTTQSNSNLFDLHQSVFEQQLAISLLLEPDGICIFDNSFWSPHLARYLSRFVHEEDGSWISAGLEFPADTDDTTPLTILRKNTSARTLADILSFYQKSAIGHYQDYPVDYARLSKIDLTGKLVDPQNVSEKIVDALAEIFVTPSMEYFLFLQENRERFHGADSIGRWLLNGFEIARRAFEECREAYVKSHDGRPGTDTRVSDMLKTVYRLRFREDLRAEADVGMKQIITEAWTGGPEREHTLTLFRFLSALYGRRDAAQNEIAINGQSKSSGLYEFFLAAHMRECSSLVAPTEDFEFRDAFAVHFGECQRKLSQSGPWFSGIH